MPQPAPSLGTPQPMATAADRNGSHRGWAIAAIGLMAAATRDHHGAGDTQGRAGSAPPDTRKLVVKLRISVSEAISNVDTGRLGIAEAEPQCEACRSSTIDRKLILTKRQNDQSSVDLRPTLVYIKLRGLLRHSSTCPARSIVTRTSTSTLPCRRTAAPRVLSPRAERIDTIHCCGRPSSNASAETAQEAGPRL
jgi:hypothetical protein